MFQRFLAVKFLDFDACFAIWFILDSGCVNIKQFVQFLS